MSTASYELTDQIGRFASKLMILEGALGQLAKEVSYEGELKYLCGIFVSMAKLGEFQHDETNVTLWDFDSSSTNWKKQEFLSV